MILPLWLLTGVKTAYAKRQAHSMCFIFALAFVATVTDWDDGLILTQDWCREVAVGERGTLSFFTSSGRGILYLLMRPCKNTVESCLSTFRRCWLRGISSLEISMNSALHKVQCGGCKLEKLAGLFPSLLNGILLQSLFLRLTGPE